MKTSSYHCYWSGMMIVLLLCVGASRSNAKNLRNLFSVQRSTDNETGSIFDPTTPQQRRRRTQEQDNDGPLPPLQPDIRVSFPFLLSKCQGDCDHNSDCEGDLLCFQRGGATTIPGCAGLAPLDGTDYCWDPRDTPPPGRVARVGNKGNPSVLFPLGQCHGHCRDDTECAGELICWERSRNVRFVPGCAGEPTPDDSSNYCVASTDLPASFVRTIATADAVAEADTATILATTRPAELSIVGPNPQRPLGLCEADCDSDEQCVGHLICLQREKSEDVPGCAGTPRDYYDYCIDPSSLIATAHTAVVVQNTEEEEQAMNLGVCEGGCQDHGDCQGSLRCFQRRFGPVPGCPTGDMRDLTNYCIEPHGTGIVNIANDQPIDLSDQKMGPSRGGLLQLCEGTCVTDASCAGNLVCIPQHEGAAATAQCGVVPFAAYCAHDGSSNTLSDVGNDWNQPQHFPLQLCEGDCDGDWDCAGELVCHQRDKSDVVPSCAGRPTRSTDYCVHASDEFAAPPESDSFRLKLFWEFGYDWQEIFWELEWCMQCASGDLCAVDDEIFLETCTNDRSTWFVFETPDASRSQIRVALTNLCLELDAVDGRRSVRIRSCDAAKENQVFQAGNDGSEQHRFTDDFFEIQTNVVDGCLTQEHHPRGGEVIYRQECERPRRDNTNFWRKY